MVNFMQTLHHLLERLVISFFVLCFTLVATYVPQPWQEINQAEAQTARLWPQLTQIGLAEVGNIAATANAASNAASAASNAVTAGATAVTAGISKTLVTKEFALDYLAFSLAKSVVSQMTSSIVNWINSGFKGSPAFVQDLEGFLLSAADSAFGNLIKELGGPLSFICSPFKLDVLVALETSYTQARGGQPAGSCTLTGALANIENFMAGSFDEGGWDAWFQITQQPEIYTPYGSFLTAKSEASIRIRDAQNNSVAELNFGGGFLSAKICETVHGAGTTKDNCFISTPGKVIQEALTFQLSTGPRALIEADEINEIISALFGQLAKQAITGAAGLLGLSGGTGYTSPGYTGGSYMAAVATAITLDPAVLGNLISDSLAVETRYRSSAEIYLPLLLAYATNTANNESRRALAQTTANSTTVLLVTLNSNIAKLNDLNARLKTLGTVPNPESLQKLMQDYTGTRFHQNEEVNAAIANWQNVLR